MKNKTVEVAVGILFQDQKILIAQRPADKDYSGYWEFPGGKIEKGEKPVEALERELYEELGIKPYHPELIFTHEYQYPERHVSLNIFRIMAFEGTPRELENQVLKWVAFDEIMTFHILGGMVGIIEKLKPFLSNLAYEA